MTQITTTEARLLDYLNWFGPYFPSGLTRSEFHDTYFVKELENTVLQAVDKGLIHLISGRGYMITNSGMTALSSYYKEHGLVNTPSDWKHILLPDTYFIIPGDWQATEENIDSLPEPIRNTIEKLQKQLEEKNSLIHSMALQIDELQTELELEYDDNDELDYDDDL